jgi:hypothetical protein
MESFRQLIHFFIASESDSFLIIYLNIENESSI